ncbi:ankyrin repeat domain-containing protein [Bdellovibrio sp. SKB1291214]|uniref:ankyrin repeat domain-containing protein n=1 Tax=Bdellovibrio sp. SKB1291214 TaxID=1732569 RepID=UPI000B51A594|nr:ankyrin repeat domain-containing protein [Bdellovibrio sp. SKB1291214]UYL10186.1 ankyrin repeat domain-containing protein [Bdellovibrio sp. SKB1291214]
MKNQLLFGLTLISCTALAEGNTPYFESAKSGDIQALGDYLSTHKSEINAVDEKGYTALIYAAYYGQEQAVTYLLKKGADPCVKDKRGNTATLGAIFKGHLGIAKTLLKSKCGVNDANEIGQTPLMFASLFGRNEIAKELLKSGADQSKKDINGNTATSLAEGQGNEEMLNILGRKSK